jgi:hypothetical protein
MYNSFFICVMYMASKSETKKNTKSLTDTNSQDTNSQNIDSNSVLFTIGRMNPPTPGHKKLVQKMMEDALKKDVKIIFVNLTSTTGSRAKGKVNPLKCIDKKVIVQKMIVKIKDELKKKYDSDKIRELQVIVNCADDKNIKNKTKPNQIPDLISGMKTQYGVNDDTNYRIYLGEKDFGKFDGFQKTFNNKLLSIKVKRPPGDMSATYLRNLTIKDDDNFLQAMQNLAVEQGLHHCTFKTPPDVGVLSDNSNSHNALAEGSLRLKKCEGLKKEIEDLTNIDRQSVFVQEMMKVGLNEAEATGIFIKIQNEIDKLYGKKKKTDKSLVLGDDKVPELFDIPLTNKQTKKNKGGSKTKSKTKKSRKNTKKE